MSETNETKDRRKARKTRTGLVISMSGEKTIHVDLENLVKHRQYGKYVRRRTRLAVHDPTGLANRGDVVEIVPCRRLSKSKSWRLVRVVREATILTRAAK